MAGSRCPGAGGRGGIRPGEGRPARCRHGESRPGEPAGGGPAGEGGRRGVRQRGGRGQPPDLDPAGQGGRQGVTGPQDGRPGRGRAHVQHARVPRRHSRDPGLGGRAAVVAGPGEDLGHDRRRAAHGLAGEFRLDGPAFAGPRRCRPGDAGHGRLSGGRPVRVRPVHLPVGQVLAERDPAAHPGPQAALAAPVRSRGRVPRRGFQRHPDRGDGPQVRQPGQRGRRRPVRQAAGEETGPGQPDPRAARAEAGRVGVTLLPPARREGPRPDLADPQPDS